MGSGGQGACSAYVCAGDARPAGRAWRALLATLLSINLTRRSRNFDAVDLPMHSPLMRGALARLSDSWQDLWPDPCLYRLGSLTSHLTARHNGGTVVTEASVVEDDHGVVMLPHPARLCASLDHRRAASERNAGPGSSGRSAHGGPPLDRPSAPNHRHRSRELASRPGVARRMAAAARSGPPHGELHRRTSSLSAFNTAAMFAAAAGAAAGGSLRPAVPGRGIAAAVARGPCGAGRRRENLAVVRGPEAAPWTGPVEPV